LRFSLLAAITLHAALFPWAAKAIASLSAKKIWTQHIFFRSKANFKITTNEVCSLFAEFLTLNALSDCGAFGFWWSAKETLAAWIAATCIGHFFRKLDSLTVFCKKLA